MTQTNRVYHGHTKGSMGLIPHPNTLCTMLLLTAMLAVLCACSATVGAGGGSKGTRVGGSIGSGGTIVGIGTSVSPNATILVYKDFLNAGPSEVRSNHRKALEALKNGDYAAAATMFENTLQQYPAHPDAIYYLGLTRIYQGDREAGFALLKSYNEPNYYRMTAEVQRMAEYLEKKPEISAKKVHEAMNRHRTDGYNQDVSASKDYKNW